jgi:hypothetical protein
MHVYELGNTHAISPSPVSYTTQQDVDMVTVGDISRSVENLTRARGSFAAITLNLQMG